MISADFQPRRRLESRAQAQAALDDTVEQCSKNLKIFDDCGQFYGFERLSFAIALANFLARDRGNSATLVVHDSGFLERQCPRVVELTRQYGAQLRILRTEPALHSFCRGLVLADHGVVLRRPHFERAVTYIDYSETALADANNLFAEILSLTSIASCGQVAGL